MLGQSETVADDYLCEVEYPLEQRNDEWEYRAFNADRSVNVLENSIAALLATSCKPGRTSCTRST